MLSRCLRTASTVSRTGAPDPEAGGERAASSLSQCARTSIAQAPPHLEAGRDDGVPGSNRRPHACKARADAAVYCRLSLSPHGAHICCALLRLVASKALPRDAA